ncbi:MAG TPA: SGNH/GDSL hydrolase family protein [Gaiellaceae bacterium]
MVRIAFLVVSCALVLGCTSGGARGNEQPTLRVLFLGNSLTATNDLPAAVAAIGRREGRTIDARMVAPGGVNLEDHWTLTGARQALADGHWDAVVLQQGPSALPESQANLKEWGQRWADAIRAAGARPALLTVWPESYRKASAFGEVIRSYANAAAAAHAELFPAGVAWRTAWRRLPRLPLYGPDGFHPSPLGTYLAAVVVYGGLTGSLPTVRGAQARVLRVAAAEALARR